MSTSPHLPLWPQRSRFEGVVRRQVRGIDLTAHSVAVLTPSLSALGTGMLMPLWVGPGFWVSIVLGFALALCMASTVSEFAQRLASGGSLYTYTAKGLRPSLALTAASALLIGYGLVIAAGVTGAVSRGGRAWEAFGGQRPELDAAGVWAVLAVLVCLAVIARGIAAASRMTIVVETVSVLTLLVVLLHLTLTHGVPALAVLSLTDASPQRVLAGAAIIAGLTVAFESSTALGLEARRPMRDVPRSLHRSLLLTGVLVLSASIVSTVVPRPDGSTAMTFRWFRPGEVVSLMDGLVLAVMSLSFLALAVCAWNSTARVVFSLAREGLLPTPLGRTTDRGVPWAAVLCLVPLVLTPSTLGALTTDALHLGAWDLLRLAVPVLGVASVLTCVAVVGFLHRIDELHSRPLALAATAAAGSSAASVHLLRTEYSETPSTVTLSAALAVVLVAVTAVWHRRTRAQLDGSDAVIGAHDVPLRSDVLPLTSGEQR